MTARAQYENMGDELINVILMREAARRGQLTIFRGDAPQWYVENLVSGLEQHGVSVTVSLSIWGFLAKIFAHWLCLRQPTILLSPGDATSERDNWMRDIALSLLLVVGVRVRCVGISAFHLPRSRLFLFRAMVRKAPSIAVRDKFTLDYLRDVGVRASLVPDLALGLDYRQGEVPLSNVALLSFRVPPQGSDLLERRVQRLIALLYAADLRPVLFSQVERDQDYNRSLAERFGLDFDERSTTRLRRWAAYEDMYRSACIVISNRLHVLLFGLLNGCAVLAFVPSGERKITGVFDMLDMLDCIASTDDGVDVGLSKSLAHKTHLPGPVLAMTANFSDLLDAVFQDREVIIDRAIQDRSKSASDRGSS